MLNAQMDHHVLYKILGETAVGVNKALSHYAISEYTTMTRDVSNRIATVYVDTLLQSYSMAIDDFEAYSVLQIHTPEGYPEGHSPQHQKIVISFIHHGPHIGSANCRIQYSNLDTYSNVSCVTMKEFALQDYTHKTKAFLVRTLSNILCDMFQHSRLATDATVNMNFIFKNRCLDELRSQETFGKYAFQLTKTTTKETSYESNYSYTCNII
jgi:hypothetical protein